MTDEKATIEISAETQAVIRAVFDLALINAKKRLETIDREQAEDNVEFDRAARTALALVRVAAEIDALTVRKRKEEGANDRRGAEAVTSDEINKLERDLIGKLAKYVNFTAPDALGVRGDGEPDVPRPQGDAL